MMASTVSQSGRSERSLYKTWLSTAGVGEITGGQAQNKVYFLKKVKVLGTTSLSTKVKVRPTKTWKYVSKRTWKYAIVSKSKVEI